MRGASRRQGALPQSQMCDATAPQVGGQADDLAYLLVLVPRLLVCVRLGAGTGLGAHAAAAAGGARAAVAVGLVCDGSQANATVAVAGRVASCRAFASRGRQGTKARGRGRMSAGLVS